MTVSRLIPFVFEAEVITKLDARGKLVKQGFIYYKGPDTVEIFLSHGKSPILLGSSLDKVVTMVSEKLGVQVHSHCIRIGPNSTLVKNYHVDFQNAKL